jgi:8-oxo-dGTP pyrophosphatase MutT (NUDIX family)
LNGDSSVLNVEHLLTRSGALQARARSVLSSPDGSPRPLRPGIQRAAVLLLLVEVGAEAALVLTQRSETVERHKGQISLPGGIVEPNESALDAALRETSEEIGVRPQDVIVLGALHDEETVVSGFSLTPFVGALRHPCALHLNPREVARAIEVPIRAMLDPGNVRLERRRLGGESRLVYVFTVGGDVVWGATARVLTQFLRVVFGATFPQPAGPRAVPGGGR